MQARGEAEGCIGWNALRGIRWHYQMHPEPSLQHHHYYNLIEIEISTQAQVCFIGRICVIIHFTIFLSFKNPMRTRGVHYSMQTSRY